MLSPWPNILQTHGIFEYPLVSLGNWWRNKWVLCWTSTSYNDYCLLFPIHQSKGLIYFSISSYFDLAAMLADVKSFIQIGPRAMAALLQIGRGDCCRGECSQLSCDIFYYLLSSKMTRKGCIHGRVTDLSSFIRPLESHFDIFCDITTRAL